MIFVGIKIGFSSAVFLFFKYLTTKLNEQDIYSQLVNMLTDLIMEIIHK